MATLRTPATRLVWHWFSAPYRVRYDLARDLGVVEPGDGRFGQYARQLAWLGRVLERGKVGRLARELGVDWPRV